MKIEDLKMLPEELTQEQNKVRRELNGLKNGKPDFSSLTALLDILRELRAGKAFPGEAAGIVERGIKTPERRSTEQ